MEKDRAVSLLKLMVTYTFFSEAPMINNDSKENLTHKLRIMFHDELCAAQVGNSVHAYFCHTLAAPLVCSYVYGPKAWGTTS